MERDFLDATPENTSVFSASHKRTKSKYKLDETPEYESKAKMEIKKDKYKNLTLRQKLELLNELLVDTCIENLESNKMKPNDLGSIVSLLKNNKVVELTPPHDESDLIDSLVSK